MTIKKVGLCSLGAFNFAIEFLPLSYGWWRNLIAPELYIKVIRFSTVDTRCRGGALQNGIAKGTEEVRVRMSEMQIKYSHPNAFSRLRGMEGERLDLFQTKAHVARFTCPEKVIPKDSDCVTAVIFPTAAPCQRYANFIVGIRCKAWVGKSVISVPNLHLRFNQCS